MPSPRHVLIFLAFVALPTFLTFFTLLGAHPRQDSPTESPSARRGTVRSFFSFHTPSTLFPPAAIISLTDDNSTFFLARPADFGPRLASDGLSGQLWVGSGFGDDNLWRGGAATGPEGELGCSDVPGWEHGDQERHGDVSLSRSAYSETDIPNAATNPKRHLDGASGPLLNKDASDRSAAGDDHLHFSLRDSQSPTFGQLQPSGAKRNLPTTHADIQSLQETAEITGKIVLLSRGGCGFLEKVKWAQRRGAAALIVGDDTRGGALVTMYARGDTSNVTIPSLFTSHTTAHLLSSLIPPERSVDDDDLENSPGQQTKAFSEPPSRAHNDRPTFTAPLRVSKTTLTRSIRQHSLTSKSRGSSVKNVQAIQKYAQPQTIWQKMGFGKRQIYGQLEEDSRRPPSSGRLSWVNEEFNEELLLEKRLINSHAEKGKLTAKTRDPAKGQHGSGDGFEIGIQDWRDPDLVATNSAGSSDDYKTNTKAALPTSSKPGNLGGHRDDLGADTKKAFSGGSITPGSGEYGHNPADLRGSSGHDSGDNEDGRDIHSWLSNALWGGNPDRETGDNDLPTTTHPQNSHWDSITGAEHNYDAEDEEHDGLWVTLTPTTMSTTPFFDTLLVLVVSPLITLTVVYALLLLRSRIRRRRWRAPKSVVERLPVRTYQTMPASSTTSSTRMATPFTSSPTSPLLQSRAQSIHSRSRAQSKASSDMGDSMSVSLTKAAAQAASKQYEQEKPARRVTPKKKYKGRQVECVVCLEEYVEGHSQVMSLPCGHEFHAECM